MRHLKHRLIPSPPPAFAYPMLWWRRKEMIMSDSAFHIRLLRSIRDNRSSSTNVIKSRSNTIQDLIILDWTTGAFLRNPIAEVSTPIIGLDSTVSSDAAREGMSGRVVGDDNKATSRSARSCSAPCETFSSVRSLRRLDSQQAWCLSPPCPSSISIPDLQAEPSSTSPSIPLRWFSRPSR